MSQAPDDAEAAIEWAWREERAAILGSVVRGVGDLQLAEDAVQEAFLSAARRWPLDGAPQRPGAWLTTAARRAAIDALRRDRFPLPSAWLVQTETEDVVEPTHRDTLALVLGCCHPALSEEAQVALTLRHVIGLTDNEIAARLFEAPATVTKRLVRARAKLKTNRMDFDLPTRAALAPRLEQVHAITYLVFTQGYGADRDPASLDEFCGEAIWLARRIRDAVPEDAESAALLALMLLHHSRKSARRTPAGELIDWEEQDQERWDRALIEEARTLLQARPPDPVHGPGPYGLQAAIALTHATATPSEPPDWALISHLYAALHRQRPSAAVAVSRAVALTRAGRPDHALALLAPLSEDHRHDGYAALHAAIADAQQARGDTLAALSAWARAEHAATSGQLRQLLRRRRERLEGTGA